MGILRSRKALEMARDLALDLILVSESANPPVAKIADFGKMKYEESKKKREHKKHTQEVKTLQIGPHISTHDLQTVANKATGFFQDGDQVRVICKFRNREIVHSHLGLTKFEELLVMLGKLAVVQSAPKLDGKMMLMVLNPGEKQNV